MIYKENFEFRTVLRRICLRLISMSECITLTFCKCNHVHFISFSS